VPNIGEGYIEDFFLDFPKLGGVVLTGGNSISPQDNERYIATSDCSKERDSTSMTLLKYAIAQDIPVLGICRGMQQINLYFGGYIERNIKDISKINHDKGNSHLVNVVGEKNIGMFGVGSFKVNSYHTQGVSTESLSKSLNVFLKSEDNLVEGLFHPYYKIAGIIYHPEREVLQDPVTDRLVEIFKSGYPLWRDQL